MLTSYPLPNPRLNPLASLAKAMRGSTEAFERVAEAFVALARKMHRYAALHGSGRTRKPYVKQPGEQFARFVPGHGLMQFKRLSDGLIVRV